MYLVGHSTSTVVDWRDPVVDDLAVPYRIADLFFSPTHHRGVDRLLQASNQIVWILSTSAELIRNQMAARILVGRSYLRVATSPILKVRGPGWRIYGIQCLTSALQVRFLAESGVSTSVLAIGVEVTVVFNVYAFVIVCISVMSDF